MQKTFHFDFDWDPAKARANLRAHRVSFERAAGVFLDPDALSDYDEGHSQTEDRWLTLGMDQAGTLLVVAHTYREQSATSAQVRMISARRATKNETKQYQRSKHR